MEETLLPPLPNEIGIQCIARVPRSFHPNLSMVCRSWRSLLRSHLFYSTRSHLKCTQQFLYFNTKHGLTLKWYVVDICNENPRKIKPLPPFPSPIGFGFGCVVLGPCLYVLGGRVNDGALVEAIRSWDMWVYDARTNRWEAGPNMMIGRMFHRATVVNGKIYVVGGDFNFSTVVDPWAEVLDPTLGSWMPLHSPLLPTVFGNERRFDICCGDVRGKLLVLTNLDDGEGNYIIRDTEGVFFDPESSSWWIERAPFHSNLGRYSPQRSAVVGGIVYLLDSSFKIKGYDAEENRWKELKVIDMETLYRPFDKVMLANVEGSLWLIWHCSSRVKEGFDYQHLKWIDKNSVLREFHQVEKDFLLRDCRQDETYFVLWEIHVRKESNGGLQGSIVRSKIILTIPNTSFVTDFLALGLHETTIDLILTSLFSIKRAYEEEETSQHRKYRGSVCSLLLPKGLGFIERRETHFTSLGMETEMEEEVLLPNLPNEIGIQCIARVPRSFHPNLSLVCRSWRSLLRSSLFYSTRSYLKCTQHFLYFNIADGESSVKWFVLDIYDENPRKIKALPPIPSHVGFGFACVVLGPCLYVLGGIEGEVPRVDSIRSSNVWVYDARTNTWEAGPNMMIGRMSTNVTVVNGKIYVVGGFFTWSTVVNPWAEVLDPTLGSWMPLHSPLLPTVFGNVRRVGIGCGDVRGKLLILTNTGVVEDNDIIMDTEGVFFDPESSSYWIQRASFHSDLVGNSIQDSAVVDGIVYRFDSSFKIKGYDAEENKWKVLKVIDMEKLYRPFDKIMLVNVEGNLWVIWHCSSKEKDFDHRNLEWIDKNSVLREFHQVEKDFVLRECRQDEKYCVLWEIMVRKESDGGLQGSIVRSKIILTVPNTSSVRDVFALGL
ncbi:uncharacterized protein LOC143857656 [Tasmannia lanceolata]|uniref:uncharacterized protein LOC143857656 n=1 Tax=Tasmannia lanceolata TaxID=3420 RepID=UPI0040627ED4